MRRGSAVGLLLLIPILLWALGQPIKRWYDENENKISETAVSRARFKAVIDNGLAADSTPGSDQTSQYSIEFLPGGQDSIVIADLQTRLQALVGAKGAELTSARTLSAKSVDAQLYLGLRLQMRGTMTTIHEILYAIETGTPFLFIDRALLRPEEPRSVQHMTGSNVPAFLAEVDVFGAKWPIPVASIKVGKQP